MGQVSCVGIASYAVLGKVVAKEDQRREYEFYEDGKTVSFFLGFARGIGMIVGVRTDG